MAMTKLFGMMIFAVALVIFYKPISADPDMLQDVCVANLTSTVKVNGFPCKPNFTASDFFSDRLATPGVTNNSVCFAATVADVLLIPGLNTLGVSLVRADLAPGCLLPPHTHPLATELAFVLQGQVDVGFITTANVLVSKTIKAGEVFAFPKGLIHYAKNNGRTSASVIAAFNSQRPGFQFIPMALFTSTPPVPNNVLSQAFQISTPEVEAIRGKLAS